MLQLILVATGPDQWSGRNKMPCISVMIVRRGKDASTILLAIRQGDQSIKVYICRIYTWYNMIAPINPVSRIKTLAVLCILTSLLGSCLKTTTTTPYAKIELNYNFESGTEGWVVGYSDYPANLTTTDSLDLYQMLYGFSVLPTSVIPIQSGIRVRGNNRSDDLFMYLKKKVNGLTPNTNYAIGFLAELASNAPTNAAGAGGAPGEAVTVKAGATNIEPRNIIDANNYYRLNIDKGIQSASGKDMLAIGHVGVSDTTTKYTIIRRATGTPLVKSSNSAGEIWLIVGTDSGFEGLTDLYYGSIKVLFEQQ